MKKRVLFLTKKRIIIILVILVILILLLIFGTKIYLYVNLMLGKDLLVRLSTDKQNLFFNNSNNSTIEFKTDIVTNPFCSIYCNYSFIDLSSNKTIEANNYTIKVLKPYYNTYTLIAPSIGSGQILYEYYLGCISKASFFCPTTPKIKSRNLLVTLNYDLSEENKLIKNNSKIEILGYYNKLEDSNIHLKESNEMINSLNITENTHSLYNMSNDFKLKLTYLNESLNEIKETWENEDYNSVSEKISLLNASFNDLDNYYFYLNDTIRNNMTILNGLIDNLSYIGNTLYSYENKNLSDDVYSQLLELNNNYNSIIDNIKDNGIINQEDSIVNSYNKALELNFNSNDNNNNITNYNINLSIKDLSYKKIIEDNNTFQESYISIKEPSPKCCLNGVCKNCCNNSCYNDESLYPVILLHGHDFSKAISSEYSFYIFDDMQKYLEGKGYINAGTMYPAQESEENVFGKVRYPISIKTSYYFDILQNQEKSILLETKKDSIDTYSIRLKDIVDEVKYLTGKDKVIFISHSMGGLVIRRYLQVFGENDVSKVIMIGSPNHGISGTTLKYCSFFGEEKECSDMNENSLFINKLTYGKKPTIPVYNIIGIGCNTDGETGDGIIKNSSSYLDYANNYYINTTCNNNIFFDYSHTDLMDISKYPETFELVDKILKNETI